MSTKTAERLFELFMIVVLALPVWGLLAGGWVLLVNDDLATIAAYRWPVVLACAGVALTLSALMMLGIKRIVRPAPVDPNTPITDPQLRKLIDCKGNTDHLIVVTTESNETDHYDGDVTPEMRSSFAAYHGFVNGWRARHIYGTDKWDDAEIAWDRWIENGDMPSGYQVQARRSGDGGEEPHGNGAG